MVFKLRSEIDHLKEDNFDKDVNIKELTLQVEELSFTINSLGMDI